MLDRQVLLDPLEEGPAAEGARGFAGQPASSPPQSPAQQPKNTPAIDPMQLLRGILGG